MNQKVGRNDPCPCGSGKKYKKCCENRIGPKKKFQATVLSSGISGGKALEGKAKQISTNFFSRPPAPPPEKGLSDLRKDAPKEEAPKHPPEADRPM